MQHAPQVKSQEPELEPETLGQVKEKEQKGAL
jgi:hypothetical protein